MAINVTPDRGAFASNQPAQSIGGRLTFVTGVVTFDDDYPTDGWPMDLSDFFPSRTAKLEGVLFVPIEEARLRYDRETAKVIAEVWDTGATQQLSSGSSALDGISAAFIAWGY